MITAIIQARMGSTRLPGKVLMELSGKTVLEHIIDRVKRSRLIEKIVVATTAKDADRPVAALAARCGAGSFTGDENDVLDRYYQAALAHQARTIVRITADDPLKDPEVIDRVISRYLEDEPNLDYVSNTIQPTYPLGLDVEVFSLEALCRAWQEAGDPFDHEHVTPYIWRNPHVFRLENVTNAEDLYHFRWTLDTPDDFEFMQSVYRALYREGDIFLMDDILELLRREPELVRLNR